VSGPRGEERDVTSITVDIARDDLDRTVLEEAEKVRSAYRELLSTDLEAFPVDRDVDDVPPIISGTYTCESEGTYLLTVFRSGSQSGYSYRIEGLEDGTYTAFTEAPSPMGTCGLSVQFVAGETYGNRAWEIKIPNTESSVYLGLRNAYILARQQETNQVSEAQQAFEKALREQTLENAVPRDEALKRADASIIQAEARLAAIDARIRERTLRAPFTSVVSNVNITIGEVASGEALTLVGDTLFELTVRIPEIDITKISIGQSADVVFDARPSENVTATVGFIAQTATLIDGVAYFEAKLHFDTPSKWFRSGLNADVNVIIEKHSDVTRIPRRFLVTEGENHSVLIPDGTTSKKQPVTISFIGNDGFVAIESGLKEGDTVIAP
jgi:RND family efflux transporter MFP subunit